MQFGNSHTGCTHNKWPLYRENLALVHNHLKIKTRSGCDCETPRVWILYQNQQMHISV